MADDIIGSVAVEVVPNTSRFVQDFKTKVLPGARQVGDELGNVAGTAAGKALADRIRDGLGEGFRRSDPAGQGSKQGDQFGGAFARTVKARLDAALRNLPKAKIDGDTTDAQKKLAELRAKLAELSGKKIGVDLTDKEALAKLAKLRLELDALSKGSKDLQLNIDARSASNELGKVKAELEDLVRAGSATGASGASGGAPGGLFIGGAIAAGLTLIGPASGAAVAGLSAVAGAGGTAFLAVKGIQQEIKEGTVAGYQYQAQFDKIKTTVGQLEATAAHGVQGGVLDALGKLNAYAPELNPIVAGISQHLGQAGSETASALISALRVASPLLEDGGRYAELLAEKLNTAANSPEFRQFIGYARSELPIIGHDMLDFGTAAIHTAEALQPIGDRLLAILDSGLKVVDVLARITTAAQHTPAVSTGGPGTGSSYFGGNNPSNFQKGGNTVVSAVRNFLTGDQGADPGGYQKRAAQQKAAASAQSAAAKQAAADAALAAEKTIEQSIAQNQLNVALSTGYTQASAFATADQTANKAIDQQAVSLAATTRQMYLQSDAGGLLKQQLDALSGKQLDAATAQNQFEQGLVSMVKKVDKSSASLAGLSSSAITNRGELLTLVQSAEGAAEAYGSLDKSGEKTRQKLVDLRQQIIDNAVAHGENRRQVTAYIDSVLKIPTRVVTKVDVDTAAAQGRAAVLQNTLGHMVGPVLTVKMRGIDGAIEALRSVVEYAANHAAIIHVTTTNTKTGATTGGKQVATGGYITGPGTSTSDSIPARLSNGEFVVRASQTARHLELLHMLNTPGFAGGGLVTIDTSASKAKAVASKTAAANKTAAKAAASLAAAQGNIRFTASLDLSRLNSAGTASAIAAVIRKLIVDVHTAAAKGVGSDSLIPTLQAENSQLGRLANERVGLTNRIKAATASLAAQRQAYAQESAQVAGSIAGVFNITSLDGPAAFGTASPAALIRNFTLEAKQAQNAATQLAQLRKLGLDKTLIQQLGEAGPGGFASIQSLATASPAQIAQINALKATVNAASKTAGDQVAGSLYQAGIDSAVGYIRGLDSQLAKVNAAASRLAKTVIKQIDKDLDIHSPSRKSRWRGQMTGEGFALGIADRYGMVTRSATGLANAAVQPARFGAGRGAVRDVHQHNYWPSGPDPQAQAEDAARRMVRRVRT